MKTMNLAVTQRVSLAKMAKSMKHSKRKSNQLLVTLLIQMRYDSTCFPSTTNNPSLLQVPAARACCKYQLGVPLCVLNGLDDNKYEICV